MTDREDDGSEPAPLDPKRLDWGEELRNVRRQRGWARFEREMAEMRARTGSPAGRDVRRAWAVLWWSFVPAALLALLVGVNLGAKGASSDLVGAVVVVAAISAPGAWALLWLVIRGAVSSALREHGTARGLPCTAEGEDEGDTREVPRS